MAAVACSTFNDVPPAAGTPTDTVDGGSAADAITGTPLPVITAKVADTMPISLERGGTVDLTIEVERRSPFGGPVEIKPTDLPPNVTAAPITILAGATTGTLTLTASQLAAHGRSNPMLTATGPDGATAYPVPFELVVRGPRGSLDESFGKKGIVEGVPGNALKIAVQADGKILFAAKDNGAEFVIGRLLENGLADTTFGTQGTARFSFGTGSDDVKGLFVHADGTIVVVGDAVAENKIGALRVTPAGALDTSFGSQGKVLAGTERATAARGAADGSVYVLTVSKDTAVRIIHITAAGAFDDTFGTDGIASIPSSAFTGAPMLVPQDIDVGALGVSVSLIVKGTPFFIGIGRVPLDGKGAPIIGELSKTLDVTQYTSPISLASDGSAAIAFNGRVGTDPERLYITNVLPDGFTEDFMFSQASVADDPQVTAMTRDKQGRLVITGAHNPFLFRVERHRADNGALDSAFGTNGITTTVIGESSTAKDVAIDPEGRIVVAGTREANGSTAVALTRYWP